MWLRLFIFIMLLQSLLVATDGDIDTSFGVDGKVITDVGDSWSKTYSVAIQNDGKIVAAGYSYNGSNEDFALVRYNTNGTLDTTFNSDGKVITDLGRDRDFGRSVAIQNNGKIVVAGYSYNGSDNDFALVRYFSSGTLDWFFGDHGKVITDLGGSYDEARSVAIQNNGKIIVAGYSWNGSNYDFSLVRYCADGSLDIKFGIGGKVITDMGSHNGDYACNIAIQSDGKIVVAGYTGSSGNEDFALVRYNGNGILDTTFSDDGKVITDLGGFDDRACGVAIQNDGKIIAAGNSHSSHNGVDSDFALVRYDANGTLDTSFGANGIVTTNMGGHDGGLSVAIQYDGKIIVAGFGDNGSNNDFALVRYNSDGTLDTTFSDDGKVTTDLGGHGDVARSVAIQSDGKIVVAGSSNSGSNSDFAVVRYIGDPITLAPIYYLLQ